MVHQEKLIGSMMRLRWTRLPPRRGLVTSNADPLRPEVVLSEESRRAFADRFKLYKTARKPRDQTDDQAAVLVPICHTNGELGLLFTLRSMKLNSNRGQVSFPGGMRDKEDRSLEDTALRETWEELRIPRERVEVWAAGNVIGKKKLNVMPIVGYVGELDPARLDINRDEVEQAFVLTLRSLCEPSLCRYTRFRGSYTLPVYLGGQQRVWGFTAAITHMVLSSLLPDVYKHSILALPPNTLLTKSPENRQ